MNPTNVAIVGAGPVGCVLAALLAKRGFEVDVYERRSDMRLGSVDAGRSINLVLTDRGLKALDLLGLRDEVLALTVPVWGRAMHAVDGTITHQSYSSGGAEGDHCNYSVSRGQLNAFLLDAAEAAGATVHFDLPATEVGFESPAILHLGEDGETKVEAGFVFGADGGFSAVRRAMERRSLVESSWTRLSHGYKELTFAAKPDGSPAMESGALHIWPRGEHMLMGLENQDGSFTGTVYLPFDGPGGFETLTDPGAIRAFFDEWYPDSIEMLGGDPERDFLDGPTGDLGTVRCWPWSHDGRFQLIGDAAHGIVPFFGQGLNCGFEDCAVLDRMLDEHALGGALFEAFSAARKPASDAIADMALQNFVEMSEHVGDVGFLLKKRVESELVARFGSTFRSRYEMVMYTDIPYHLAMELGAIQSELLDELTERAQALDDVDFELARTLIAQRVVPFCASHDIDLNRAFGLQ